MGVHETVERFRPPSWDAFESPHRLASLVAHDFAFAGELLEIRGVEGMAEAEAASPGEAIARYSITDSTDLAEAQAKLNAAFATATPTVVPLSRRRTS